jgi:hypothetical protein
MRLSKTPTPTSGHWNHRMMLLAAAIFHHDSPQIGPDGRYVYHFDAFRSNRSNIAGRRAWQCYPRSPQLTRLCSGADVREGCPASRMVVGPLAGWLKDQRFPQPSADGGWEAVREGSLEVGRLLTVGGVAEPRLSDT